MDRIITGQGLIRSEGDLSNSLYIMDDHIKEPHDHATPPQQQHSYIPASQPQAPLPQHFGAHRLQHPNQAHSFGQMSASSLQQPRSHHSVLSSMDLMLPSTFSKQPSAANNLSSFGRGYPFQSSSHHTSHTAAAGDLLSMSHRSMEASSNNSKEQTKKRTASYSGRSHMESMMMTTQSNYFITPQQQQNVFSWNATTAAPGSHHLPPSNNAVSRLSTGASQLSSSSTIASASGSWYSQQQGQQDSENDESYQHHRTIRQCRRSDSFEMMDDGC
eukprot:CCRYP_007746-RA/>CCRYP_007746-RA protein AED:0.21 eAED:0.21 QI:762/1/1/1/0/0/3/2274/272